MAAPYRFKGFNTPDEEKSMKSDKKPFDWERFFKYKLPNMMIGIALTVFLAGATATFVMIFATENKISYCFIDSRPVTKGVFDTYYYSVLKGHRAWRSDVELGMFDTPEKAKAFAQEIECPLYKK